MFFRKSKISFALALVLSLTFIIQIFPVSVGALSTIPGEDEYVSIHQYVSPTDDKNVFKVSIDINAKLFPGPTLVTFILDNSESMDMVNIGTPNRDVRFDSIVNGTFVSRTSGDIWDVSTNSFITRRQAVIKSVEAAINTLKQKKKDKELIFVNILGIGDPKYTPLSATDGTSLFSEDAAFANLTGMGHFEGFIPLFDPTGTTVNPDVQTAIDAYAAFALNAGHNFHGQKISVTAGPAEIAYDSLKEAMLKIDKQSAASWTGGTVDRFVGEFSLQRSARYVMMLSDGDMGNETLEGLDHLAAMKYPTQYDSDGHMLNALTSDISLPTIYGEDYSLGATVWGTVFGSDGMHIADPVTTLASYKSSGDFTDASGWTPTWVPATATLAVPLPPPMQGITPFQAVTAVLSEKTPIRWPSTVRSSVENAADFDATRKALDAGNAAAGAGKGDFTPAFDSYRVVEPYMILASSEIDNPLETLGSGAPLATDWPLADADFIKIYARWMVNLGGVYGYAWEPGDTLPASSDPEYTPWDGLVTGVFAQESRFYATDFRQATRSMPATPSNGYGSSNNVHYFWIQHINGNIVADANTSTERPPFAYYDNSEYFASASGQDYCRELQNEVMTNADRSGYGSKDGVDVFKQFSLAALAPLSHETAKVTISDVFDLTSYKSFPIVSVTASDGGDAGTVSWSGRKINWLPPTMENDVSYTLTFYVEPNEGAKYSDMFYSVAEMTFVVDGITIKSQEVYISPSTGVSKSEETTATSVEKVVPKEEKSSKDSESKPASIMSISEGFSSRAEIIKTETGKTKSGRDKVVIVVKNGSNMLFQWQVKDENGGWKDIFGANSSILLIGKQFSMGKTYTFRCVVRNKAGVMFYGDAIELKISQNTNIKDSLKSKK